MHIQTRLASPEKTFDYKGAELQIGDKVKRFENLTSERVLELVGPVYGEGMGNYIRTTRGLIHPTQVTKC
jgi:hypothetical protein